MNKRSLNRPFKRVPLPKLLVLACTVMELKGSFKLFEGLVGRRWEKGFLVLDKGQSVEQEMFLDL